MPKLSDEEFKKILDESAEYFMNKNLNAKDKVNAKKFINGDVKFTILEYHQNELNKEYFNNKIKQIQKQKNKDNIEYQTKEIIKQQNTETRNYEIKKIQDEELELLNKIKGKIIKKNFTNEVLIYDDENVNFKLPQIKNKNPNYGSGVEQLSNLFEISDLQKKNIFFN